jgi:hypothetical protein
MLLKVLNYTKIMGKCASANTASRTKPKTSNALFSVSLVVIATLTASPVFKLSDIYINKEKERGGN